MVRRALSTGGEAPGTGIMPPAEFSRVFRVDDLPIGGSTVTLTADPSECAALAQRFGLSALGGLKATARLTPLPAERAVGRSVRVEGEFKSEVEQSCVVTLDPVISRPHGAFAVTFAEVTPTEDDEALLDPAAEDPPEPLVEGAFDLGELVAEQLALALDPYPRSPGAVFEAPEPSGNTVRESPFAVLRRLAAKS